MFYQCTIQEVDGIMQYPFDINKIKKPLYSEDKRIIYFESDHVFDEAPEVLLISAEEYLSIEEQINTRMIIPQQSITTEENLLRRLEATENMLLQLMSEGMV